MMPLRGVVIQASRRSLVIKLETGQRLEADNRSLRLERFDQVQVGYDYTTNTVKDIAPFDPDMERREGGIDVQNTERLEEGEYEDIPLESLDDDVSGALCPLDDEDWDWEEGVRKKGDSFLDFL